MCVCVIVCVCKRERERERCWECKIKIKRPPFLTMTILAARVKKDNLKKLKKLQCPQQKMCTNHHSFFSNIFFLSVFGFILISICYIWDFLESPINKFNTMCGNEAIRLPLCSPSLPDGDLYLGPEPLSVLNKWWSNEEEGRWFGW